MAGEIVVEVTHRFDSGVTVRAAFTRTIDAGSILVLFGASGAGKTTILRTIAGLLQTDGGRIVFNGAEWFDGTTGRFVPPQRRGVGYVSQAVALFPHLTVRANVEYGLHAATADTRHRRAAEVIQIVGAHGLEDRYPPQLSGGQAQRVALARALAPAPALLLLDEPFGSLDASTRRELRTEVRTMLRQTATSAILVTHDRLEAMSMGDDLAVMIDGRVHQIGSVAEVFRRPADPAVARSLGVETVVPALVEGTSDGLVNLRIGDAQLVAVASTESALGADVFACMRAEDVILQRDRPAGGSARNHLAGTVVSIEPEGPIDRVTVDCGFPLIAVITRQSRDELALAEGSPVTAAIKATAIHVVRRS